VADAGSPLPRALFFDLDDTLFDHSLTVRAAIGELSRTRAFLRGRPLDELCRTYLGLLQSDWGGVMARRTTTRDARRGRWIRLAAACGTELPTDEAEAISQEYRASYQRLRRTVPGARELLDRWHGRAVIGIISNNETEEQEEKLSALGLRERVDLLVTFEESGAPKPDPRIFETALRRAGTGAAEAAMVGDSWEADVIGALSAGVRPVWFNRFGAAKPPGPPVLELRDLRPATGLEAALGGRPAGGGR
jgi:HAD superfamily hydrolase (TIGR01549 family)